MPDLRLRAGPDPSLTEIHHPEATDEVPSDDDLPASSEPPSDRRVRRVLLAALGVPIALVLLVAAASTFDARSRNEVVRNTELADVAIGGLDRQELGEVVAELAERYAATEIVIETGSGELAVPGAEFGLSLQQEATVDAALALSSEESLLERPFTWAASFFDAREAPVVVTVDETRVGQIVEERDPTERRPPVEPSIRGREGTIEIVDGEDGRGLRSDEIADEILTAASDGELPVVIETEAGAVPPRFDADDAAGLAEQVSELTSEPIAVEGTETSIPVEVQRGWVGSQATEEGLALHFDDEARNRMIADLESLLPDLGVDPVDAGVTVRGGSPVVVPAEEGTTCCDPAAADRLIEVIGDPAADAVELPLRPQPPDRTTAEVEALGIRELVATYTTNFTPGQSRNQNIQRMADLVRGEIVEPGNRFSVNGHIGRRTRAKGFTDGGEIRDGILQSAVGGGVSQFATTLFNAAFYAGLEIPEYQMHSLYFSRYPYGREATLSFPKPDLVIENNTGNGILLWSTHTDSSVTVSIYGTPVFTAEQTGQSETPVGPCTRVTTQRTRTRLSNGRQTTDSFVARYRPEEGVDC